jgi:antitoxin ParD1/3/4
MPLPSRPRAARTGPRRRSRRCGARAERGDEYPSWTYLDILCRATIKETPVGTNVNLTAQLKELVRSKMVSGRYTSAREVVREAPRLIDEQDRLRAAKLEPLREDVRQGLDSGTSQPWGSEQVKLAGRARRARSSQHIHHGSGA